MLQSKVLDRFPKISLLPMTVDGRKQGLDTNGGRQILQEITIKDNATYGSTAKAL